MVTLHPGQAIMALHPLSISVPAVGIPVFPRWFHPMSFIQRNADPGSHCVIRNTLVGKTENLALASD